MKTLILALGNPILSDDGIAWAVADCLSMRLSPEKYTVEKESGATLDLVPRLAPFSRLIVIDAIQLGQKPVGSVYQFSLQDFEATIRSSSAHDINFATAFAVGRNLGYKIPESIMIFGIEVKELRTFSEQLSQELTQNLEKICNEIYSAIIGLHSGVPAKASPAADLPRIFSDRGIFIV
jgi:hydrogenase maturation protease